MIYHDTSIARNPGGYQPVPVARETRETIIELLLRAGWWGLGIRRWTEARMMGRDAFRIITQSPEYPVRRGAGRRHLRSCLLLLAYALARRNRVDFRELTFLQRVREIIDDDGITLEQIADCEEAIVMFNRAVDGWIP